MIAALEAARRRGLIPGAASPVKDVAPATLSPMSPVVPNVLGTREPACSKASPLSPLSPTKNSVSGVDKKNGEARTDESEALMIATRAISMAALTDEQRLSRLADLQRDPAIANFWIAFADVTPCTNQVPSMLHISKVLPRLFNQG